MLYFIYSFQHTYIAPGSWNGMTRLLYNPSVLYFDSLEHLPYALILLFALLTVAVPPVILLAFYQTKCFQKFMSCIHLQRILSIHIFVDLLQGCYRNGLNGGYDLRFTASLYMVLRIAVLLTYVGCNNTTFTNCDTLLTFIWVLSLLLFFALARPYKDQRMNILDSLLLAGLAVINILLCSISYSVEYKTLNLLVLFLVLIIIASPQAVLLTYILYKLCGYLLKFKFPCIKRCFERVSGGRLNASHAADIELTESLPDRVDHPYNYCDNHDF